MTKPDIQGRHVELGMACRPASGGIGTLAREVEAAGFDILLFSDTQNLAPGLYGPLTEAALATTRLRVGPGVTNPVTRHVAVTASEMASLQAASRGRAICGIGRGDSAVSHAGLRPASVRETRDGLTALRMYWGREDPEGMPARHPLQWLRPGDVAPPPIDVAATGEQVIRLAADLADRVTFTVGAASDRIAWAMDVLEQRLAETGRARDELQVGAYVNAAMAADVTSAIQLVRPRAAVLARFAATATAARDESSAHWNVARRLDRAYDPSSHGAPDADYEAEVPDDFIERFAVVGTAQRCQERIGELIACGLDHLYIVGPTHPIDDARGQVEAMVRDNIRFGEMVLDPLRDP